MIDLRAIDVFSDQAMKSYTEAVCFRLSSRVSAGIEEKTGDKSISIWLRYGLLLTPEAMTRGLVAITGRL